MSASTPNVFNGDLREDGRGRDPGHAIDLSISQAPEISLRAADDPLHYAELERERDPDVVEVDVEIVEPQEVAPGVLRTFFREYRNAEVERYSRVSQEMTFNEYLEHLIEQPSRYVRNPARYQADAFEHYGYEERTILGNQILDFNAKLFPWQSESFGRCQELIGQEIPTYEYYKLCLQFASEERPSALICAHGAPGGGKTTFFRMRDEMLEDYSKNTEEGVLYRLVWQFTEAESKNLGFLQGAKEKGASGSVGLRIPADNNTDPFFLISNERVTNEPGARTPREALLGLLEENGKIDDKFNRNYFLSRGLDTLSQTLYEHLLREYKGDAEKIFERHVRVERWDMSAELGRGVVPIRPNPESRADIRPIVQGGWDGRRLPSVLAGVGSELHSTGSLILSANRGVVHYSDMFRPGPMDRGEADLSRFNSLLETVEGGTVQVLSHRDASQVRNVRTYVMFTADTNDEHIMQKIRAPGFDALQERTYFISFPLMGRFLSEAQAYRHELEASTSRQVAAPHALETLALFTTSTRLLKPDPGYRAYGEVPGLSDMLRSFSVVEKALLLEEKNPISDSNVVRDGTSELSAHQVRLLETHKRSIALEHMWGVGQTRFSLYDGGIGISTRAGVKIARGLASECGEAPITAIEVVEHLGELMRGGFRYFEDIRAARNRYAEVIAEELRKQRGGNHYGDAPEIPASEIRERLDKLFPIPDPAEILKSVTVYAQKKVEEDVSISLGLYSTENAEARLLRYVWHVRAFLNKGNFEVPVDYRLSKMRDDGRASEELMRAFEDHNVVGARLESESDRARFRQEIFGQIGAWQLENPDQRFDQHLPYALPKVFDDIRHCDRKIQRDALDRFRETTMLYESEPGQFEEDLHSLDSTRRRRAEGWGEAVSALVEMGYPRESIAKHVVWALGQK